MSRRLPTISVLALTLAVTLGAGCADSTAPAVRARGLTITEPDLQAELAEWAASPTLLSNLSIATTAGGAPGSYNTAFVDFVLSTRLSFERHNEQFKRLGLTISDKDLADVRAGIFTDPAQSAAVFKELSPAFGDRLVADVARQFAVSQTMSAADYQAWQTKALHGSDIHVSPRYGTWNPSTGGVVPPLGPLVAPAGT